MFSIGLTFNKTECRVIFDSDAEKQDYVEQELKYTNKQLREYIGSITSKEREAARKKLNKKRYEFAIKMGYKLTGTRFMKNSELIDPLLA